MNATLLGFVDELVKLGEEQPNQAAAIKAVNERRTALRQGQRPGTPSFYGSKRGFPAAPPVRKEPVSETGKGTPTWSGPKVPNVPFTVGQGRRYYSHVGRQGAAAKPATRTAATPKATGGTSG